MIALMDDTKELTHLDRITGSDGRSVPAKWAPLEVRVSNAERARELRAAGLPLRKVREQLAAEGIVRSFGWVWNACNPK